MSESSTRRSPVTMSDVARHAGVSTMTVSNVINGRSARVGARTRDRVLASISDLGYRVNPSARSLRRGRTGVVGLAVPYHDSEYHSQLAERLAHRFAEHGLRLAVERTGGDVQGELDSLAVSRLDAYDGFVLSIGAGEASQVEQMAPTTPVVLIGERAPATRLDHVLMDNVDGGRQATALLLRSGARRIALVGGLLVDRESMPQMRTQGYVRAHMQAGVEIVPDLVVPCDFTRDGGEQATARLLAADVPFDAVFALTDSSALGALRALADAGLRVPEDVQVVGFDNISDSRFSVPSLTTVEPDNLAMADAIVGLLTSRIASGEASPEPRLVMPAARLVLRESTRALPPAATDLDEG